MVNLNWPEQERGKLIAEVSPNINRRVTKEANQKPKATISAGVVLCNRYKCESELEITLDEQRQPTTSVFDIIETSYQQSSVPTSTRDTTRKKAYQRLAQCIRKMTKQPKKEIPIKMPKNDKPLATIIEGRWYSVGKSSKPTLELTRTQKRKIHRQHCTFLKNRDKT
ncbi:PREDICTED: LOC109949659 [Prunus dulcis]|uniref:PREDICTED: LOC109949659 n=1 Tax=Prunus dulcis TaxID=3755 RepID=A0A5E4G596_PRUDU|nr:PREDICTED: LOC109949659 [Prunus dulcis]